MLDLLIGLALLGLFFAVRFHPSLFVVVDMIKQGFRAKNIRMIAKHLDWEFEVKQQAKPAKIKYRIVKGRYDYQVPHWQSKRSKLEMNVINGAIGDIPVCIFDVPIGITVEWTHRTKRHVKAFPPQTIMTLKFPTKKLPMFNLRPRNWADGHVNKENTLGENFVIRGEKKDILKQLFDRETLVYLDRQENLHVRGSESTIDIQYQPDHYLPATKENYLNLIAQGEVFVNLMSQYIEEPAPTISRIDNRLSNPSDFKG